MSLPPSGVEVSFQNIFMDNCVEVATTALCIYDYLLTLHRETGCIWKERFSVASSLFLLNRYVTLCNCIVNMVELVPWVARNSLSADHVVNLLYDHGSCTMLGVLGDSCLVVMNLVFAVFAVIRTYAMWNKDLRVFVLLVAGLIYPLGSIYAATREVYHASPSEMAGCSYHDTLPGDFSVSVGGNDFFCTFSTSTNCVCENLLTRSHLKSHHIDILGVCVSMLFELGIIILTYIKIVHTARSLRRSNANTTAHLSYIVLCNGTLHFTAILLMNAVGLLALIWKLNFIESTSITDTLTSMLVSRFILDLRENYVSRADEDEYTLHISDLTTIGFEPPGPI